MSQQPLFTRVIGTGSGLPERCVSNAELSTQLDTTDAWISSRTGIRSRYIASPGEDASDLAYVASVQALAAARITSEALDLIIVATTTPDHVFPSTACVLQQKLGAGAIPAFDVQAVCSGFIYALDIADKYIRCGAARRVLVVGTEIFSRLLDWNDRQTCVLFGDGAGAVVLEAAPEPGLLSSVLKADGRYAHLLNVQGHLSQGTVQGRGFIAMDGPAVFKFAVKVLAEIAEQALQCAGVTIDQIRWLVPHQANLRIIESTAAKLGLPMERVIVTVDQHGNTSAASVPLALDAAVQRGCLQPGDLILLESIGGGFTWGAAVLRWS